MSMLAESLTEAHVDRARAAADDLRHAAAAPALFKPEFVAQRGRDLETSLAWARYWGGQVTPR